VFGHLADLLTKLIPTALVGAINVVPISVVVTLLMARVGLALLGRPIDGRLRKRRRSKKAICLS